MSLDIAHITENISTTGFWVQEDAHIGALVDSIIRTDSQSYTEEVLSLHKAAVFQNDVSH
jgi:hypothetical protein